jgi:hypothetical protein
MNRSYMIPTCPSQSVQQSTTGTQASTVCYNTLIQTQTHVQNHPSIKQPVIIIDSQLINPIINPCNYHSNHSLIESLNVLPTYAAEAAPPTPTALIHPDLIVIALPFCIAIAMAHLNCLLTCAAGTYD